MASGTSKCGITEFEWTQPWLTQKAITNAGNMKMSDADFNINKCVVMENWKLKMVSLLRK